MRLWTLAILLVACEGNGGFTLVEPLGADPDDTGVSEGDIACSQVSTQGLCTEFTGSSYTPTEVQGNCAGGTVLERCPSSDVLGICGLQVDSVFETRTYYYLGSIFDSSNIDGAESQCVLKGGEWL